MHSPPSHDAGPTTVRSICTSPPGCHGGCGVLLECNGGRLTGVRGDPANPFNRGVLCPSGLAIRSSLYSPDRITTPILREGRRGSGRWRGISWEKALDIAAEMLCEARDSSGPESVAFCKGTGRDIGPYLSRLAFGFGSPNYFAFGPGTGSACLMPRMAASRAVMGGFPVADCSQYFPQRYSDPRWRLPGCILVWGGNPIRSNPDGFLGQWIVDCIRRGTRLIVVDPRRTWLASRAAVHLQLKPGTDGALALAMLGSIISEGSMDREFVAVMEWSRASRRSLHAREPLRSCPWTARPGCTTASGPSPAGGWSMCPGGLVGQCDCLAAAGIGLVPVGPVLPSGPVDPGFSPVARKGCLSCPALCICGGGCRYDAWCATGDAGGVLEDRCRFEVGLLGWMIGRLHSICGKPSLQGRFHVPSAEERALLTGRAGCFRREAAPMPVATVYREGSS